MSRLWALLKDAGEGFVADDALTRAGAIAYFTLFSIGPILFIATGIAGFFVGRDQVDEALAAQLGSMVGEEAAGAVQEMANSALGEVRGGWALLIGFGTLLLTASGAFGALQTALNAIWKAKTPEADTTAETITRFMRAKAAALGLVATTGFILIASLAVSAAISSFGGWLEAVLPGGAVLAFALNIAVSVGVLTLLFAAIYKVLPDREIAWRDVLLGAFVTALLFTAGKTLIGTYVGASGVASGFGAAGTIVVVLVWLYYSAVIFLAGAEFTRAWANRKGSRQGAAAVPARPEDAFRAEAAAAAGRPGGAVALSAGAPARRREASPVEHAIAAAVPLLLTALLRAALDRGGPAERRDRRHAASEARRHPSLNPFRKGVRT